MQHLGRKHQSKIHIQGTEQANKIGAAQNELEKLMKDQVTARC